mmetsp:Transcript_7148/g.21798  ORF Transcript_7148/g.21798 Transcript_7148/m.21798 type:complete len:231 (-) Transcript_7148:357-1049(-)
MHVPKLSVDRRRKPVMQEAVVRSDACVDAPKCPGHGVVHHILAEARHFLLDRHGDVRLLSDVCHRREQWAFRPIKILQLLAHLFRNNMNIVDTKVQVPAEVLSKPLGGAGFLAPGTIPVKIFTDDPSFSEQVIDLHPQLQNSSLFPCIFRLAGSMELLFRNTSRLELLLHLSDNVVHLLFGCIVPLRDFLRDWAGLWKFSVDVPTYCLMKSVIVLPGFCLTCDSAPSVSR